MGRRSFLEGLRERFALIAPEWSGWGRLAWCLRQRRALRTPRSSVVWVRGPELAWASWGERRGLFEIDRMDGLAYLRALPARPGGPSILVPPAPAPQAEEA